MFSVLVSITILFSMIVSNYLEQREFCQSVEIYQLDWDTRITVAKLKYPETNDGIWEWL
jgi:hypothetical protein